jgi:hypothetical protein
LIWGGHDFKQHFDDLHVFDIKNLIWKQIKFNQPLEVVQILKETQERIWNQPIQRACFSFEFLEDRNLLVLIGGFGTSQSLLNEDKKNLSKEDVKKRMVENNQRYYDVYFADLTKITSQKLLD